MTVVAANLADEECELRDEFRKVFARGGEPAFCRAPGRVNLIGEHTDYNGLPVLPMTIADHIGVAFAPRAGGRVRMRSTPPAFPEAEFENGATIAPSETGSWDNYCKAAVAGLNEHFGVTAFSGMDMLVTGTIPIAAGLSSSSALVVACALAYLRCLDKALGEDIARLELAEVLAEAEHYVGTRGGGMDHAAILLGDVNAACVIGFFPLRFERVPLPEDHAIVVCDSLVKAKKTGQALHRYNAGPRLCQLMAALVAKQVCRDFGEEVEIVRLGDLIYGHLCLTYSEVEALFAETFPSDATTLKRAAQMLGISPEEIRAQWLGDLKEPTEGFRLRARARHQLSEYRRVEAARDCLAGGDCATLGELMNASHESCARDYEISCPELDRLAQTARASGAIGARLTGAGFGGCTVNLVPRGEIEGFRRSLEEEYYGACLGLTGDPPVFEAQASAGAGYVPV